jgi:hypothetical protein
MRLVQMTVLDDGADRAVRAAEVPCDVAAGQFDVWRGDASADAPRWHVFVADGRWRVDESALAQGDSARGAGRLELRGSGVALVWLLSEL